MKNKLFLVYLAALLTIHHPSHAQIDFSGQTILDTKEDTAEITTLDDIITMQQGVSTMSYKMKRVNAVWSRRTYRNFSYNTTKLKSKEEVPLGRMESDTETNQPFLKRKLDFKSDWGVSFTFGTNYRLHRPIANILSIGLDYTWLDLGVSHFKTENDVNFSSSETFRYDEDNTNYHFIPWEFEKYEGNLGMMLGPSITVAPFINMKSNALAQFRFQAYFHIGYRVSGVLMTDKKENKHYVHDKDGEPASDIGLMAEWGHGMYSSFGVSLTWMAIGVGYESVSGNIKYKPLDADYFGKNNYEFQLNSSRVYFQIRL